MAIPYKWLPVINKDCCTGCGKCVEVCDHNCLDMVWSYSTLVCPTHCGSEGTCQAACPEDAIRMEWVPTDGDQCHGQWQFREDPPPPTRRRWTERVFGIRQHGG